MFLSAAPLSSLATELVISISSRNNHWSWGQQTGAKWYYFSVWSHAALFHKDHFLRQSYYTSAIWRGFQDLFGQINGLTYCRSTRDCLAVGVYVCAYVHMQAQLHKRRSAVVAEILLTFKVQRISTLPVAINFVFLISPIVSKKEKIDGRVQPADVCQLTVLKWLITKEKGHGLISAAVSLSFKSKIKLNVWIEHSIKSSHFTNINEQYITVSGTVRVA